MCSICDGSGMSHRCPVCSDDYDYEPTYAECPNCCGGEGHITVDHDQYSHYE